MARKVVQLRSAAAIETVTWESTALALVESRGGAAGPLYSVLESQLLGKNKKVHEKH